MTEKKVLPRLRLMFRRRAATAADGAKVPQGQTCQTPWWNGEHRKYLEGVMERERKNQPKYEFWILEEKSDE